MTAMTMKFGVGASVLRKEDERFIRGAGRYTDDITLGGMLHGFVLRSPMANARIVSIDSSAALEAEGVRLVLTGHDLKHLKPLQCEKRVRNREGKVVEAKPIPVLCADQVRHVGDAVAFIVAETRAQAVDAAELVQVDYDSLEAAGDPIGALDDAAPLVWPDLGSNLAFYTQKGDIAATEAAFANAAHVSKLDLLNQRLICNYMEPRSVIGEWNTAENRYVLTLGSQGVHGIQTLVADNLDIDPSMLRVVTHDVGGGFGTKSFNYRENALVLEAAKRLGQPVKWTGDRGEHFVTDAHGRDNVASAEMAMDENGRFLALRVQLKAAMGAYIHQFGPYIPGFAEAMATGVYDIPAMNFEIFGIYSHTVPTDAYRGAGRPEAAYLIETLVDACARDLGISRDEIRRRNFIKPEQFPYVTPAGRKYDVGEFEGHMNRAMEIAVWGSFDARAAAAKADGKLRGIGMATYIEACAFAGSEPAHVRLNGDGTVTLFIGTQTNGQGHATAYAQFVAEKLDLDVDQIEVRQGDTDELSSGGGTGGSRSIPLGGVSSSRAGAALAEKIRTIAADELEAAPADIELFEGTARIVGTDRSITLADVAKAAKSPDDLKAEGNFVQDEATYPNGTHLCEVEIDPATGMTEILSYVIVDDFGATVNPVLLAGQVHGGVVQGIGQALTENAVYDETGQLLSASFMDYGMPRADIAPFFHFETRNVPSTTNAMGIKGAGEAGTIGACPAVMNAVRDALYREKGIRDFDMPATPHRVWDVLNAG